MLGGVVIGLEAPVEGGHTEGTAHAHGRALLRCDGGTLAGLLRRAPRLCVHGSEPPPPGVDLDRRPDTDELARRRFGLPAAEGAAEAAADSVRQPVVAARGWSVACAGDGRSGNRVQAIYAHAADVPSRLPQVAGLLRQYAADADSDISQAARRVGAGRRVRYVTTGSSPCALQIDRVQLSAGGDDSFQDMVRELRAQGYDRADRKYLVWVDASVGICGLAQVYLDDRPGRETNYNNRGPMYARVDAPCWGYAEAHELLHTLGAVQRSAPNATSAGHCTDARDTMCYRDTSSTVLRQVCPDAPTRLVDCRADDYFNADPGGASYLGRHWNTADSDWLLARDPPPRPPRVSLRAPRTALAGGPVRLRARVSVPAGRTHRVAWSTTGRRCGFVDLGRSAATYHCPATLRGSTRVTVRVRDSEGMTASRSAVIRPASPARPRATGLTLTASTRQVTFGDPAVLTATLRDRRSRAPVVGMPVALYALRPGGRWRQIATSRTDDRGRVQLTERPATNTLYALTSGGTAAWRISRSRRVGIRVRPEVDAAASPERVPPGGTLTVSGRVRPGRPGGAVELQRRTGDDWTAVGETAVSAAGAYEIVTEAPVEVGTILYRVVTPATRRHARGVSSLVEVSLGP